MKKFLKIFAPIALVAVIFAAQAHAVQAQTVTVVAGCFPGYTYSTVSGALCSTSTVDYGCNAGYTFSTISGARCPTNGINYGTASCFPGDIFDTTTGARCPVTSPSFPNTGAEPMAYFTILAVAAAAFVGAIVVPRLYKRVVTTA